MQLHTTFSSNFRDKIITSVEQNSHFQMTAQSKTLNSQPDDRPGEANHRGPKEADFIRSVRTGSTLQRTQKNKIQIVDHVSNYSRHKKEPRKAPRVILLRTSERL